MDDQAKVAPVERKPIRRAKRRGQRGSIFRRPGAANYTIIYRSPDARQKWEGGFATKEDAQERLDVVLGSIRKNTYVEAKKILFEEFCDDWMGKAKAMLKPKTWTSYESALKNWITPKFGRWPICDISRASVKAFKDELLANKDVSRKFVKNVLVLLHRLFEEAIDREYLAANPARKLPHDLPDDDSENVSVIVPTPEEVVKTFAELPPTYQVLLATAAVTCFRRAELLGLYWDDVDWLNGSIRVRRTLQRIPKKLLDGGEFRKVERIGATGLALVAPKSKRARRSVEMPVKIAALLTSLRDREKGTESPFVFQSEIGTPLDPDGVYDVLHSAQDKAKARRFGLHGLRHLYSSLLVANKADVKFAQERLGHASALTTLNIYSHAITDRGREYAAAVEAAFPFVSNLLAEGQIGSSDRRTVN
ncbi:MAG TPA: site-specific integrase [Candidatus Acidoferrales bacterium]|nr:site-specific integrase [Candidatus Acidoferrales bacterium]